jgi:predicted metal-dependent hydrolase
MSEMVEVGGLNFEVRRSSRRRTLGLTVGRVGDVVVHVPLDTSSEDLSRWVTRKLLWVHRKLKLKKQTIRKMNAPEYVSGETFCYLGRRYKLKVVDSQDQALKFDGTHFTLRRDARPADEHFRRWYIATGSDWLKRRVQLVSKRTITTPLDVKVRELGYRWGSCSKNGVIFFNWKLLQLPVRLVDYVIAHELTHLAEANHDSAFFDALSRAMPDWKRRKDDLATRVNEYLMFGLWRRTGTERVQTVSFACEPKVKALR